MQHDIFNSGTVEMLSQPVPRYTSYPTAPHFRADFSADLYNEWLYSLSLKTPISLYFHIPFCERMCWYCGCHTQITRRDDLVEKYIFALINEISLITSKLPHRAKVCHVHFGGGTPNIVPPHLFKKLMTAIHQKFEIIDSAELAIELDPRTLQDDFIDMLGSENFTRASLGVQDFDLKVQRAINREQPFELVQEKFQRLRDVGIQGINFDLIYGLPLQNQQTILDTLHKTSLLQPDRLSVFGYAHVPWMKSHQKMVEKSPLPNARERLVLFDALCNGLKKDGYQMIGIDHFARPKDPLSQALKEKKLHRNFQGYTTDPAKTLLGFGASAISQNEKGFIQNIIGIGDYQKQIINNSLPVSRGLKTSQDDQQRAAIIEQIMCYGRVNLREFFTPQKIAPSTTDETLKNLAPYLQKNIIELSRDQILTIKDPQLVPFFARLIASAFDQYFEATVKRHSKAI